MEPRLRAWKILSDFQMKGNNYTACFKLKKKKQKKKLQQRNWDNRQMPIAKQLLYFGHSGIFKKKIFLSKGWKSCLLLWGAGLCNPCAARRFPKSCLPADGASACPRAPCWDGSWGAHLLTVVAGCSALSLQQEALSSKGKVDLCILHIYIVRGCSYSHQLG